MTRQLLILATMSLFIGNTHGADIVLDSGGFESLSVGLPPPTWTPFPNKTRPSVVIATGGAYGSTQSLRSERSNSGGLTSLSKSFDPQHRVQIDFTFAVSDTSGRSLNIWTHEPGGSDASQLNLCVQNGALMQYDGRTHRWDVIVDKIQASRDPTQPVWYRLRAIVDAEAGGIDYWVSEPDRKQLPKDPITRHAYRMGLPISAIDIVSGRRVAPGAWFLIDDLTIKAGADLPAPHPVQSLPQTVSLWSGPSIPIEVNQIPWIDRVKHRTIHRAVDDGYKFLHGAAIVGLQKTLYANWANSPTHENGPLETLQGRRSSDGGKTWSNLEIVAGGFDGSERHSHGVLFVHKGQLWTICARFGVGEPGRHFPGLCGEAFVLNPQKSTWQSRGIVMQNCWPYDEPMQMPNGNFITGGQDKDGLPVVAISHGDDLTTWDTIRIPYHPDLKPNYAETSVWAEGNHVLAIIRGGANVAWISTSNDAGRTWTTAAPSNMPMPRSKAYLGKLSTGQLFLVSNLVNRDTLAISVGKPGELMLSKIWRIRSGKSDPPKFPGRGKSKQWSYPYAHEHDGKLYVVYSIGKEDCGLSVIPVKSLRAN